MRIRADLDLQRFKYIFEFVVTEVVVYPLPAEKYPPCTSIPGSKNLSFGLLFTFNGSSAEIYPPYIPGSKSSGRSPTVPTPSRSSAENLKFWPASYS